MRGGCYGGGLIYPYISTHDLDCRWAATGISNSLIANRLSYQLNVRGPSLVRFSTHSHTHIYIYIHRI